MAQWNSLRYALPAFILLGRVGGLGEQQIQERWTRGDRAALALEVVGAGKKETRPSVPLAETVEISTRHTGSP